MGDTPARARHDAHTSGSQVGGDLPERAADALRRLLTLSPDEVASVRAASPPRRRPQRQYGPVLAVGDDDNDAEHDNDGRTVDDQAGAVRRGR